MVVRALKSKHTGSFRLIAALCLAVWASALIACAADCGSIQNKSGCCHKKASATPPEKAFCLHRQPVPPIRQTLEISRPALDLIPHFLAEFQLTPPALESPASPLRQSARADFVFAPEVSLGAAFRSLAPPVLP